jgi:hypothetical protein
LPEGAQVLRIRMSFIKTWDSVFAWSEPPAFLRN